MSTSISICVGVISLVCMIVFYSVLSGSVTNTVSKQSTENMITALDGQANLIDLFVSDSETIMKEYGTAHELKELLLDPENPEKIAVAQAYTEKYFGNLYQMMMNTVESLSGSATENARTTELLSTGAGTAAQAIQSVNADIDNITAIVRESKSANHQRIAEANDMIHSTDKMFTAVSERTEKTEKDIEGSVSCLNALTSINENVKTIQDIASHTNLLAINASVEAARAGEAAVGKRRLKRSGIGDISDLLI